MYTWKNITHTGVARVKNIPDRDTGNKCHSSHILKGTNQIYIQQNKWVDHLSIVC